MSNLALSFLAAHQQWIEGVALGIILSNPIRCATIAFNLAVKVIPGFGPWIARNPDKAKAWSDGFDKGIDAAVDKYASDQRAASSPPKP